jgi:3-oxoacyl-[acyl-carrier protein] reductase
MARAFLALGSNLGDRAATLRSALDELARTSGVRVVCVSSFHETAPVGGPPGQGAYLNAAAELDTSLDPAELLARILAVEEQFGRVRSEKDAPRTLDLDLLLYDDLVRAEPDPVVPHPRMHEREFVLAPLAEVAPEIVHPGSQRRVRELLSAARGHTPSPIRLDGLRAAVTGSTSGIGRAIALELARHGADVLVHGRNVSAGETVASLIGAMGRRAAFHAADFAVRSAHGPFADAAWDKWSGIDVWVNNAGADVLTGGAWHAPFEDKLDTLLAVDVTATVQLSRAIGERMHKRGRGVIINIGWDQAETGMAGDSGQLFGAAKGAVMAYSKSLAVTLAPHVRVNCLAPGWIKTAWGDGASQEWQDRVRRETPLERWGTPEDVAAAAAWLASPAATFITGQVVRVNGGVVR